MEKDLYVNYLNCPKRAKFNPDSKVVLQQILQASIWNNCVTFTKTESKPVRRAMLNYGEKSNLKAEVKFDSRPYCTDACKCVYRNQVCCLHEITEKVNHLKNGDKVKEAVKPKTNKLNSNIHDYERVSKCRHHQNFHSPLHSNSKNLKVKSHHANRFFPYMHKKYSSLGPGASFRQNTLPHHSSAFKLRYRSFKSMKNCSSLTKSNPTCLLDCNVLCSCANIPVPSSNLVISTYDYQSYAIRKYLAVCLASSMKTPKRNASVQVSVPMPIKKNIEVWCEQLSAKFSSSASVHCLEKTNSPNRKTKFNYYYYEKDSENVYHQIKADISLSLNFLCDACLLSFLEKCLISEAFNGKSTTNGKVESSVSNKPLCCDTTTSNCIFQSNGMMLNSSNHVNTAPEKRISSRLKEKRDSGLQGPFSDDYVFEVPMAKKVKRPKLSHPYSHKLFWNFYEKHVYSEKNKWISQARAYYNISAMLKHCSTTEERSYNGFEQKSESLHLNGVSKFSSFQKPGIVNFLFLLP